MRIIPDTNVLLQSLPKKSRMRLIWSAFLSERYYLLVTSSIMFEYEEKIGKKTSRNVAFNVVSLISEAVNSTFVTIYYEWHIITADPDDNKFIDAAIAGNADYIVTNDAHFKQASLINFPRVNVIDADRFVEVLNSNE